MLYKCASCQFLFSIHRPEVCMCICRACVFRLASSRCAEQMASIGTMRLVGAVFPVRHICGLVRTFPIWPTMWVPRLGLRLHNTLVASSPCWTLLPPLSTPRSDSAGVPDSASRVMHLFRECFARRRVDAPMLQVQGMLSQLLR